VESELDAESCSLLAPVPQFMPTTQIGTTLTSASVACSDALGAANQLRISEAVEYTRCMFSLNRAVFRYCYDHELRPRWQ
jgi:hypothetical protein